MCCVVLCCVGNINIKNSVDKKNQLDVTFCILYFSSSSCSTCFGQPFCKPKRSELLRSQLVVVLYFKNQLFALK